MKDVPVARRGLWEAEYRLDLGHKAWVVGHTVRNLDACQNRQWGSHVAQCHIVLGTAVAEEDPARSRQHLEAARQWCARTTEVELVLRTHELAARIHLAAGSASEAADELERGCGLAKDCAAAHFHDRLSAVRSLVSK